jgi:ABC-type taurine transport system substrate-binding protein
VLRKERYSIKSNFPIIMVKGMEDSMKENKSYRTLLCVLMLLVILLSVGCGPKKDTINVGYGSNLDAADVADQFGIDELAKTNDIKVVQLTEDSSVVAGLIKGEVQIGSIGCPDAIKAVQAGVPLRFLLPSQMVMEFVLIGQPGIKTVDDMKGKKVAYHAPGSGTEILPRMLVRQSSTITEADIEWVILPESPNRAAAMEGNRIDVTALEYADVMTLKESGKPYEIIASFADVAPEAIQGCWVVTEDYAASHLEFLKEFSIAIAKGYELSATDKTAWMNEAKVKLTQAVESRLSGAYDFYLSVNNFPQAPFFTQELWDKMNNFYISAGEFSDPAPYSLVMADVNQAAADAMK